MSKHSVASHLHLVVEEYDQLIHTLVPHYATMLSSGVDTLQSFIPDAPHILDLGGGTGALTAAILEACSDAKVEVVDIDPQMLGQAKTRLAPYGTRVIFHESDFFAALAEAGPRYDAIVASLSLHHLHDLAEKTRLYALIHAALKEGGVFLNLDATVSSDEGLRRDTFRRWTLFMEGHGITAEQAATHFASWAKEDRYFSLHEELTALAQAGFTHPECFWRCGPSTIYGGARRAPAQDDGVSGAR